MGAWVWTCIMIGVGWRVRDDWGRGCVDSDKCKVAWCVNLNEGMDAAV